MNKKAVMVGALAFAMSTVVAVGSSLAYFTDTDSAKNVFTVGDVDINLTEPLWNQSESHTIVPGAKINKDPTIKNIGTNDAYIRVKMTISKFSTLMEKFSAGVDNGVIEGFDKNAWTVVEETVDADNDICNVVLLYNNILKNTETDGIKVFEAINIPDELDEELDSIRTATPEISIQAEAIQSDGFDDAISAFDAYDIQKSGK